MGKRESNAVYRRRRTVAVIVLLLPVAIVLRACAVSATPKPAPQVSNSVSETSTVQTHPKPNITATDTATTSAKPTTSATPQTGDCANSDIEVSITADALSYAIGSPVTMAMRITNTGSAACKRDVGAVSNEVYVTDANGAVVWSSDACQTNPKPQVVVMRPAAVFGNSQVWSGSNSGRDCTQAAPDAAAGSYLAYGRNDTVVSKAFAFTIS